MYIIYQAAVGGERVCNKYCNKYCAYIDGQILNVSKIELTEYFSYYRRKPP